MLASKHRHKKQAQTAGCFIENVLERFRTCFVMDGLESDGRVNSPCPPQKEEEMIRHP
jgi:hypothetical protein